MITSEEDLLKLVEGLKAEIPITSLLLFRGQTKLYDKIRSGKARPDAFVIKEVENGWNTIVNRLTNTHNNDLKYNQAILQHYGFPTYYIDLTKDPLTAAWFACNDYKPLKPTMWIGNTFRIHDETTYSKIEEGIGHLIVLEIPEYKKMIEANQLFDITHESKFLRPKSQDAYLMLDHPPRLPNPNNFIKKIIEIDRSKFSSSKTLKGLFPHPNSDKGYAELLDVPFVQLPSYYMKDKSKKDEPEDETSISLDKHFLIGKRAIQIPFYTETKEDLFNFNPKWKDTVIYEPSPFRLWKTETFNLSEIHEGQQSVFGETSKITISPIAFNKLVTDYPDIEYAWPEINSNSIFFTKAVLDHDKVIDHSPPYFGIWLHKDNDLILELHMISDDDENIQIQLGHAYTFTNNSIDYVKVEKECDCNKPEDHLDIIKSMLKIPSLIKKQEVALAQHAFMIDKWYVLI